MDACCSKEKKSWMRADADIEIKPPPSFFSGLVHVIDAKGASQVRPLALTNCALSFVCSIYKYEPICIHCSAQGRREPKQQKQQQASSSSRELGQLAVRLRPQRGGGEASENVQRAAATRHVLLRPLPEAPRGEGLPLRLVIQTTPFSFRCQFSRAVRLATGFQSQGTAGVLIESQQFSTCSSEF